ncbi:MAG: transcription-repair coupling factor, partial [Bacteroidota bacterium]
MIRLHVTPTFAPVNNLDRLHKMYAEDERVRSLAQCFTSTSGDKPRILTTGLIGAQECFVILGLNSNSITNQVVIAIDKEEAAYIQNTLDSIHPDKRVSLFPDSFKRPAKFEQIDAHNVLQRTEAINRINLNAKGGEIVVTYPEAIFEKVVNPALIRDQRIEVSVGENLDLDTILEVLVEYGFERVDFVYEPGQFSIRGGIVDIFSYGNEFPYRVELFDDEVESVRTF